jgi:MFS family permease
MSGLAIMMGLYSATAVILELPSGIMADLIGRKRTFLMAQTAMFLSTASILSGSLFLVYLGMILAGMGRALSSGTMDAYYIDQRSPAIGMEKAVARVNLLDGSGLALGAIIGGFLPVLSDNILYIKNSYDISLIFRLLLTILITYLTAVYIVDNREVEKKHSAGLTEHLFDAVSILKNNKQLRILFLAIFSTGFLLFSVETYWQPAFAALPTADGYMWLLGIVSFMFFAASSMGVVLAERRAKQLLKSPKIFYIASRILLAATVLGLSFSRSILLFSFCLVSMYFFFGTSNLSEGILLNGAVPSSKRSSFLSLSSLVMQAGGFTGSIFSSVMLNTTSISSLWFISFSVILLSTAVFGLAAVGTAKVKLRI